VIFTCHELCDELANQIIPNNLSDSKENAFDMHGWKNGCLYEMLGFGNASTLSFFFACI